MSASDELPRGWDIPTTAVGAGSTPSITVPAVPGVQHILTSIVAAVAIVTSGGPGHLTAIEINGGTRGYISTGDSTTATSLGNVGTFSWTGKFISDLGAALVVAFTGPIAVDCQGTLEIQGYDI